MFRSNGKSWVQTKNYHLHNHDAYVWSASQEGYGSFGTYVWLKKEHGHNSIIEAHCQADIVLL